MDDFDEFDDELITGIDVSKIVLTEEEQELFSKFKETDFAYLDFNTFKILRDCGAVIKMRKFNGICKISKMGKQLRTYQNMQKERVKVDNIKYIITTAIASLALILSIVSICLR